MFGYIMMNPMVNYFAIDFTGEVDACTATIAFGTQDA